MKYFKIWVDDVRRPPNFDEYIWCRSTRDAIAAINMYEKNYNYDCIIIDLDHDAGDYVKQGGDYIKILDWLEEKRFVDTGYFFRLHSMNPVGISNMRTIIQKNDWREIR